MIVTAAGSIGTFVHQYLGDPAEKYSEKVNELQQDRWGDVSTELGELFAEVEQSIENGEAEVKEDIPKSAKMGFYIQQEYSRGDLDELESCIREVDKPREYFETCRECRDMVFKRLMVVIGLGIIAASTGFLLPQTIGLFTSPLATGAALGTFGSAVQRGRQWMNARENLDELWEDYAFM